ncbi:hypothetical protein GWK47_031412 [Chionoecetes opilio]|uniref:Uncharacterized protein n=1 Tax=Chionoecetes opilio TaxID=41210 RepID=A0A8J4YKP6_CHIOP|nr:hypothetical protein GWK47_031412 [Chionoecetes opilio]
MLGHLKRLLDWNIHQRLQKIILSSWPPGGGVPILSVLPVLTTWPDGWPKGPLCRKTCSSMTMEREEDWRGSVKIGFCDQVYAKNWKRGNDSVTQPRNLDFITDGRGSFDDGVRRRGSAMRRHLWDLFRETRSGWPSSMPHQPRAEGEMVRGMKRPSRPKPPPIKNTNNSTGPFPLLLVRSMQVLKSYRRPATHLPLASPKHEKGFVFQVREERAGVLKVTNASRTRNSPHLTFPGTPEKGERKTQFLLKLARLHTKLP